MHVQKGCPHFSRPLLHTAAFLLPYRKNNQGVVRNGGLPQMPYFSFLWFYAKELKLFISVPGICGITAHKIIQISMGYQGCGVQCWGPWWSLNFAWMVWSNFCSSTQGRNFSMAACLDREVSQTRLRGESWIFNPKKRNVLIKKWEVLRHFCLSSSNNGNMKIFHFVSLDWFQCY